MTLELSYPQRVALGRLNETRWQRADGCLLHASALRALVRRGLAERRDTLSGPEFRKIAAQSAVSTAA
jgi:hypothetical protein